MLDSDKQFRESLRFRSFGDSAVRTIIHGKFILLWETFVPCNVGQICPPHYSFDISLGVHVQIASAT